MEWRSGSDIPAGTVGFRAGYEAGFVKSCQGLMVTVRGEWRNFDVSDLPGGEWQAGWRAGWVAGCEDGRRAREGEESLTGKKNG